MSSTIVPALQRLAVRALVAVVAVLAVPGVPFMHWLERRRSAAEGVIPTGNLGAAYSGTFGFLWERFREGSL